MKLPRWKLAYAASLLLFLAGALLLCTTGRAALGGLLLLLGGLLRFVFCRCPHCGAAMMRIRREGVCPACLEPLEDHKKKD